MNGRNFFPIYATSKKGLQMKQKHGIQFVVKGENVEMHQMRKYNEGAFTGRNKVHVMETMLNLQRIIKHKKIIEVCLY